MSVRENPSAEAAPPVQKLLLEKSIQLCGPMKASIQIVREQLALLETAEKLELEGFRELVEGSSLSPDELYERATENCYIAAAEALKVGLVADILK
jgi:hypothetical protein